MEGELRTVGTVTELNGNKAKVVFTRSKACGDCHACVSFGSDQAETELANTLGAKVGDRVSIELHSGSVFTASLIMYGIPLVALLAGVLIGSFISDLFTAVFGIGAAVIAFLIIRLFEPKFKKMGKFDPRMIEIVSE
ncbi:MAG: SoxR reducing system RseC family protein [Clostridia bacterium]|nr:SoxR reducing system RseC family protein [Clostridia bacterium]MBQ2111080.1 SoxR reducing system RseC family protein [Clostridia bacterium]MBQ5488012.1 SoxR reducing system RseC family protein [Clostridia bacterium]MBR4636928.1 SoxR reducing system RseC family protein [Clostridia bacterium]